MKYEQTIDCNDRLIEEIYFLVKQNRLAMLRFLITENVLNLVN